MNLRRLADHPALRFPLRLFERARDANLDQVAGSLTFTTLLSLVPMITIALALFSAFPRFGEFRSALEDYLADSFLPDEVGAAVMAHVADFAANAAQLTLFGLVALGLTAYFLLQTVDRALSAIWRVRRSRSIPRRMVVYTIAAVAGPLVAGGSIAATTFLVSSSMGLLPDAAWLDKFLLTALPFGVTTLAVSLLYKIAPNCRVRWRHAVLGGLIAAAGFEAMKSLFGLFLATFPTYQLVYGAFAAFPIFLVWIYLSWMVALVGALVAAELAPPADDLQTRILT